MKIALNLKKSLKTVKNFKKFLNIFLVKITIKNPWDFLTGFQMKNPKVSPSENLTDF